MDRTTATPRPSSPLSPAVLALEGASVLDPIVKGGDAVAGVVAGGPLRRAALQGAWLGHALHPLLVQVPLGTWMSATALDLLRGPQARAEATALTGLGLAAAVPAALTGWAEYAEAGHRDRRVGVVHAGANAAGMLLQTASLAARTAGRHRLGVVLGLGGVGVSGAAGYLGGHLTAARKVGSRDRVFAEDAAPVHR